jgi:hypothetical protein
MDGACALLLLLVIGFGIWWFFFNGKKRDRYEYESGKSARHHRPTYNDDRNMGFDRDGMPINNNFPIYQSCVCLPEQGTAASQCDTICGDNDQCPPGCYPFIHNN